MNSTSPSYAIFRTKVQRAADLQTVDRHNRRTIPVLGADPTVKDGVRVIRLDGISAYDAVDLRIQESGAKRPGRGRIIAFEVIATFSPEADPAPSKELLAERGAAFFDRIYGRGNVVGIWEHSDEKSPHLHALVVPICEGPAPGRPRGGGDPKKGLVVSWNRFSGSFARDFRDPKKAKNAPKRKQRPQTTLVTRRNLVMAGWQTAWADEWADYGLRRGIPSTRGHLPMKWIRGCHEAIAGKAEAAMAGITAATRTFELSGLDLLKLRKNPTTETVSALFLKYLMPEVEGCLEPLKIQAAKGIQLESERKARADLKDAYDALKKQFESRRAANEGGQPGNEELRIENKNLRDEVERLAAALEKPDAQALLDQFGHLSDAEFNRLTEARKAGRQQKSRAAPTPGKRPPLSIPRPEPQPDMGQSR
jgi:hypothetical protein